MKSFGNMIKSRDELIPAAIFLSLESWRSPLPAFFMVMKIGCSLPSINFAGASCEVKTFGGVIFLKLRCPVEIVVDVLNPHQKGSLMI